MGKTSTDLLHQTLDILERRYGALEFVSGKGIPKGQRLKFMYEGRSVTCMVKLSSVQSRGRISFQMLDDGSFNGLRDADLVVVAGPNDLEGREWLASMYDQRTLLAAFAKNREALKQQSDKSELGQSWIAPFHEEGRDFRGAGDGFLSNAIWSSPLQPPSGTVPAVAPAIEPKDLISEKDVASAANARPLKLNIREAKAALALYYEVPPDDVDITIRG